MPITRRRSTVPRRARLLLALPLAAVLATAVVAPAAGQGCTPDNPACVPPTPIPTVREELQARAEQMRAEAAERRAELEALAADLRARVR
jgi:hypothetical protein